MPSKKRIVWVEYWSLVALIVLFVGACGGDEKGTDTNGNTDISQDRLDTSDTSQDTPDIEDDVTVDVPDTTADDGSEPDDSPTPCAGIDCGGHGSCLVSDSNEAYCDCDAGYHADGTTCVEDCEPKCGDRVCGPNPLCPDESCGDCEENKTCNDQGQCECTSKCGDRVCGPNPLCPDESCGDCEDPETCNDDGQCECVAKCIDRVCGPDPVCPETSCGGDCGENKECNDQGQCECTSKCGDRVCGPNPLCPDESCGDCSVDKVCNRLGECIPKLEADCTEHWCLIPAGDFAMGCSDDSCEPGDYSCAHQGGYFCDQNTYPVHSVTLTRSFYMKRTQVSQKEWRELIGNNPSNFNSCENCPVENVNWFDAVTYANRLSESEQLESCYTITGCTGSVGNVLDNCTVTFSSLDCKGYRLPTEAEWEYVVRAGTTGARYDDVGFIAWYGDNSESSTHPCGTKDPNGWGIHDLYGNVWEWVHDNFDHNYYSDCEAGCTDPVGPTSQKDKPSKSMRGGSYSNPDSSMRAHHRNYSVVNTATRMIGFRLVRSAL